MSSLKENLQIQTSGAVLGAEEAAYKSKIRFLSLPLWERIVILASLALLIPGFIAVRYGTEIYLTYNYGRGALAAQPAFTNPNKLQASKVTIIENGNGAYTAYAVVQNPNLDLGLDKLAYSFSFTDSSGKEIYSSSGKTYLLPNQKKWLVVPRIQTKESISAGKLTIDEPDWQKRLSLPDVELKMSEPYIYSQDIPPATVAEGAVVNNSPYTLTQVDLMLVLYGRNNQVLAVTPRQEFKVEAYERRAYKLQWPGIDRDDVVRVALEAYTNTMDNNNLIYDRQAPAQTPVDDRDKR